MPFAALASRPSTGEAAAQRSRTLLDREVAGRTAAILAELEGIADRFADGRAVTADEVLHAADRIAALRVTIAFTGVLGDAA